MMLFFVITLALTGISPLELESEGRLAEAGAAWEASGDIAGQVRVMGRLIEEAIYAGDGRRAVLLSGELRGVCADSDLFDFWTARTAWISGLSTTAAVELENMNPEDMWLDHRAAGLSALFLEDGEKAIEELTASIVCASTARKAFWSGLDLCSAYLFMGMYDEALELSHMIRVNYPGDALGDVMYGLCLQASGYAGESTRVLYSVDSWNPTAENMARAIMEGFEQ